jgi:hypothetical protein
MHSAMHLPESIVLGDAGDLMSQRGRSAMIRQFQLATCLAATLACSACSTKPRTFSMTVRPAADMAVPASSETESYTICNQLVRSGRKAEFAAAAGQSAAAGVGAIGGAVASVGMTGSFSAVGSGAVAAMPVVGLAAAFGVNRLIRSGRERSYKRTMTRCMGELGYDVVDWARMKKKTPGTATLAVPASPEPVSPGPATEASPAAS